MVPICLLVSVLHPTLKLWGFLGFVSQIPTRILETFHLFIRRTLSPTSPGSFWALEIHPVTKPFIDFALREHKLWGQDKHKKNNHTIGCVIAK